MHRGKRVATAGFALVYGLVIHIMCPIGQGVWGGVKRGLQLLAFKPTMIHISIIALIY